MGNEDLIISLAGALILLLLAGNGYFLKKVFDKVDSTEANQVHSKVEIAKVSTKVDVLGKQVGEIKEDVKELRGLGVEVARIKGRCENKKTKLA